MTDVSPTAPGWYGKIPAVGDFVSRRLPQHFIDLWHDWLQQGIAASRSALQDGWLDQYLNSPIWRFLLTPGICGEFTWAGTLMPSVDRVGRYFPLTLAVQMEGRNENLSMITAANNWYAALEQLSLSMLDMNSSVNELEDGLIGTPFPQLGDSAVRSAKEFALWWTIGDATPKVIDLMGPGAVNELVQMATGEGFIAKGSGRSLWWTSEHMKLHCFIGLPPPGYFSVLLENRTIV
ncbi:MAG: type VI secretion system-associated protein TagF [Pseudolabrys sp.]